ncbi:MAG: N-acetylmuramoyl-L-alanine amidase [Archangium sp.]|nr:N-acetylmuramoyl-L-alanine amidase [Archangium sp.]
MCPRGSSAGWCLVQPEFRWADLAVRVTSALGGGTFRPVRWALAISLTAVVAQAAPVVVIDPGHGGAQEGAASPSGALEKNVALAVSKRLKGVLEKNFGATVRLTRDADALVHLSQRVELANKLKPDVFISIHCNSMPKHRQQLVNEGVETYFLSASASGEDAKKVAARENAEGQTQTKGPTGDTLAFILADLQRSETHVDSSRLAYAVHEAVVTQTGAANRGVQQAPFFVLMGLDAPAVLVEIGFISHPTEGPKLVDVAYQEQVAAAIAQGISLFLAQVDARDVKKGAKKEAAAAP